DDMGAALGAAPAFHPGLQRVEVELARQRHEIARIEALAMAAIQTERPEKPLRPAGIGQGFDRPDPVSHKEQIRNLRRASRVEYSGKGRRRRAYPIRRFPGKGVKPASSLSQARMAGAAAPGAS